MPPESPPTNTPEDRHNATDTGVELEGLEYELSAGDFRSLVGSEYGIDGATPRDRVEQLKQLPVERLADMLDIINRRLQGSEESLVHDKTMRIGDVEAVPPECRYDVFNRVIEAIDASADDISPARVADVLALTVVMLHPFRDGNGRTARAIGLMFRDD